MKLSSLKIPAILTSVSLIGVFMFGSAEQASAQILIGVQIENNSSTAYTGTGVLGETFLQLSSGAGQGQTFGDDLGSISLGHGATFSLVESAGGTGSVYTQSPLNGGQTGDASNLFATAINTSTYQNNSNKFVFSGLTAGGTYNLAVYGGVASGAGGGPTEITGDVSGYLNLDSDGSGHNASLDNATFINNSHGNNYLVFDNVTASLAGTITLYSTGAGSEGGNDQYSLLSGISIQQAASAAVPEPTTWAMLFGGFGVLILTLRFRGLTRSL